MKRYYINLSFIVLLSMTFSTGPQLSFHSYAMRLASTYAWVTCRYRAETGPASVTHGLCWV